MTTARELRQIYGDDALIGNFQVAVLKKNSGVLGYYDGDNIAINEVYFNAKAMNEAYEKTVAARYHPSSGNKSGIEAVAAHEFGHALTDKIAEKMGLRGLNKLDKAADKIVNEARKNTKWRGVVQMSNAISRYATSSNAEAVAEAVSDVYCNGQGAKSESQAIVNVIRSYLKKG